MEYKSKIHKPIILDEGNIDGFDYLILSFGTHPTAYVRIPESHPFYNKSFDDLDIACHGGLTYSSDSITDIITEKGWWIGWNYSHADDYRGFPDKIGNEMLNGGKKWTTEEIKAEVQNVVEQLKAKVQLELYLNPTLPVI